MGVEATAFWNSRETWDSANSSESHLPQRKGCPILNARFAFRVG
jgi:hypothetical protein